MSRLIVTVAALVFLVNLSAPAQAQEIYDPLEPMNRKVFWFNDQLDIYLLEPVARGYDYIMPEFAQTGVANFFDNLRYPSYLVSDLVQLKFVQAAEHTGRFLVNSTVGIGGLIDVAKHIGLPDHEEDFGTALGYHGVPPGPYLVLPVIGPSNVRDAVGTVVDFFLDPLNIELYVDAVGIADDAIFVAWPLRIVQRRADLIQAVETAKETSTDYYLFMQSSYHQYREGLIHDGMPPDEEWLDDDEDFGDDEEIQDESEATKGVVQ